MSEYSVNKSTSAHPQSKSYQLLFFLHLFSAVKGKTKIIPTGQGKKRRKKMHNTHQGKEILMAVSRKKNLLFSRHFDTLIKKGHDDDDGAIKNKTVSS